jgi:hypothetical protein
MRVHALEATGGYTYARMLGVFFKGLQAMALGWEPSEEELPTPLAQR